MRVSIIGGGGLVGSCAAFALQCGGIVSGIDLIDVNADLCKGQALDLLHGASLVADQRIRATGYEAIPESDLVMITAGLRRKPDESRLDLINRNVELFLNILGQVKGAGPKSEAIVLVVSNPVDVLTYLATTQLGLPPHQVIGLGTALDTARFRSLIAEALRLPPTQVTALILGEHGDSMVPIWSAAQAAGLPLEKYPGWTSAGAEALFTRTKGSGAEVIKLKGGAGFAVGSVDPRGGSLRGPRHEANPPRVVPGAGPVRHPRRLYLGSDRGGPERGRGPARDRPSGPRKSRPCSTRPRCSARRSTRFKKATARRPASPAAASRSDLGRENRRQPPSRPRDHGSGSRRQPGSIGVTRHHLGSGPGPGPGTRRSLR